MRTHAFAPRYDPSALHPRYAVKNMETRSATKIRMHAPRKGMMQRDSTTISRPSAPGVQSVQFVSALRNFAFVTSFGEQRTIVHAILLHT